MNTYKDGKIYKIYKENGVGYVVDENKKIYLFTVNDVNSNWDELLDGDLVRFRAEQVNDSNRAYFVKKSKTVLSMKNEKPID